MGDIPLALRSCGILRHNAAKTTQHVAHTAPPGATRGTGSGVNAA